MSARVCGQHLQGLAPCRPRGGRALQASGRGLFLQLPRRVAYGRLKVSTKTQFRSRIAYRYTGPEGDEDLGSSAFDFSVAHCEDSSPSNGYSRSSEGERRNDDHVNGYAQDGNGQVPKDGDGGEYYVPVVGHRVVGVVVSGNQLQLDVSIGAAKLAQLPVQNLLPLDRIAVEASKWVMGDDAGAGSPGASAGMPSPGHPHILYDAEIFQDASSDPLVEVGTVLEMEVIRETDSGVAVLSARKAASRVAWDRVVQIRDENEPLEVVITELNSSGFIARIEGLRAFLPCNELIKKPDTSRGESHDDYMGRTLWVTVVLAREMRESIVISEKDAWIKRNLQLWSLHEGTVIRLFPYGALVQVQDLDIWGMIHISNIADARIGQVSDVFEVGERVKMLLVESPVPDRFSFSTALLESEPGLMLQDKQRVFREAEGRAAELRKSLANSKQPTRDDEDDEAEKPTPWKATKPISNWEWLEFIKEEASLS